MTRVRKALDHTARTAAVVAGSAVRLASLSGPSIGGAILISYGLGEIYRPLMWIAAGVFLLLADRKRAMERGR